MSPNRAYLFDGALLREHGESLDALQTTQAIYLYRDLGDEAAAVGPILVPDTQAVQAFANRLVNAEDSRRFTASLLISRVSLASLAEHLSRLRYVETTHEAPRRYFLRYADTRVLSALRQVATPEQQHDLMADVERWVWVTPDKAFLELRRDIEWNGTSSGLPLQFTPEQLTRFIRQGRYHELLQATLDHCPESATLGTLGERHEWTRQASEWVRAQDIRDAGIQVAVNESAWRTRGAAMASDEFVSVVREAVQEGSTSIIRRWSVARVVGKTS
ncbi:conserved hypothetical protein [Paraburkholderia tropica]|uniref:DUF4123 domain-containing protein n=1 Tax=Paraburkholderia tropica TaxID=92647 RepID=UPI001CAEC457|nr:DUF4123 domain-containing protein [Paraburkholderia tropica]CAG9194146.1 conserved hypothetical protein [Paraburkholderia tropica]